jgi:hypothetical protein
MSLTRVGSDHNPLLLNDGGDAVQGRRRFIFEHAWLSKTKFRKKMIETWPKWHGEDIQGYWKAMKKSMRQLSKGMSANMDGEMKRERERERKELLRKIKILENKAELRGLSEEDWVERYKLEGQLEDIFAYEEHVW